MKVKKAKGERKRGKGHRVTGTWTRRPGKDMKDGTLVLNVIHGKEVDVEYGKNEIIDKINSFFGYTCINNVKLNIVQDNLEKKKNILPKIKNFKKIEEKIRNVSDSNLKNSLNDFLKAYNEKNG